MPTLPIACLGLSHHTAPLELREQLRCTLAELDQVIDPQSGCQRFGGCGEFALLSTCNRVELYACLDPEIVDARAFLSEILTETTGVDIQRVADYFYYYSGMDAVNHLCRVAAGLESLVLGEQQILGQVSDAFRETAELGAAGPHISMVFHAAIRAGRKARTVTSISQNPASLSSVAIAHARKQAGDLSERQVLVVGLGEMGTLTLKALRARGATKVSIANRTPERARAAADQFGYDTVAMSELPHALSLADVVITATASPEIIITPQMVREAVVRRDGRSLVFVDIAVPRNVDPAVGDLSGVSLCDTDRLRGTLDEALTMRQKEVPLVEEVIDRVLASVQSELEGMSFRPLITELRQKAESIRQRELKRALHNLGDVDEETREQIQHFSYSLVNKLLHEPTVRLKKEAGNGHAAEYEATVRNLFGLVEDREGSVR
ncbi:MAG: glutamyl-tRNA reductase [Candidatus Krumholzibacteriia bacterium]